MTANPMLQALNESRMTSNTLAAKGMISKFSGMAKDLKAVAGFFKTGNTNAVIERYASQIPLVKQLQDIGKRYGGNYDQAFRDYAAKSGLDPDAIMGELQELGVF